jgi:hypothetical protein
MAASIVPTTSFKKRLFEAGGNASFCSGGEPVLGDVRVSEGRDRGAIVFYDTIPSGLPDSYWLYRLLIKSDGLSI